MATNERPWAVERLNSAGAWEEVDSFMTSIQANSAAKIWQWQRNAWHRARFITADELAAKAHAKERTLFVPKPGEEYDSLDGNRHVYVIQVTFSETTPEGRVFYGPGEGEELLSLFVQKYQLTPSKGDAHGSG